MAAIAMISEEPSSTPSRGRNESDRYSKKKSSQATLPRALARSLAFTSASDRPLPTPDIDGRFMISLKVV
jgi:hypothetical protein